MRRKKKREEDLVRNRKVIKEESRRRLRSKVFFLGGSFNKEISLTLFCKKSIYMNQLKAIQISRDEKQ